MRLCAAWLAWYTSATKAIARENNAATSAIRHVTTKRKTTCDKRWNTKGWENDPAQGRIPYFRAVLFGQKKNAKQTLQKTHVFAHLNVNTAAQKISVPQNKKDPSFDFATNGAIRQHRKKNSSSPRCVATDLGARESKSESVPV